MRGLPRPGPVKPPLVSITEQAQNPTTAVIHAQQEEHGTQEAAEKRMTDSMARFGSNRGVPGQPDLAELGQVFIPPAAEAVAGAAAGVESAVGRQALKAVNLALNGYFAYTTGKGAVQQTGEAYKSYQAGDYLGAVRNLGTAGLEGALAWMNTKAARGQFQGIADIAKAKAILQEQLNAKYAAEKMGDTGAPRIEGEVTPQPAQGVAPEPQPPAGFSPVEEAPTETGEAPLPATVKKGQTFETPAGKVRVVSNASGQVVYQTTTPEGKKLAPAVLPADQFQAMVKTPEPPAGFTPVEEPAVAPAPTGGSPYEQAVALARSRPDGKISTSTLQRQLRMGYGAASQMLSQMETDGIVGPGAGGKPRDVLSPAATTAVAEPATPVAPGLKEEKQHDFASTQANLPAPVAEKIADAVALIPPEKLADKGIETEPHVTVKYGLHGEDPAAVAEVLKDEPPIEVTLGKASVFEGKDGKPDVLKVDVDSPALHELNAKIADALPHTDTFPDYHPHVTIAYLKPGEGAAYEGKAIEGVTGEKITLPSVTFSDKGGKATEIPLAEAAPVSNDTAPVSSEAPETPERQPAPVPTEAPESPLPNEVKPAEEVKAPIHDPAALGNYLDTLTTKDHTYAKYYVDKTLGYPVAQGMYAAAVRNLPDEVKSKLYALAVAQKQAGSAAPKAEPAPVAETQAETPTPLAKSAPPAAASASKAIANHLRKNAAALQGQIDAKRNPAIANQNPTARRARIAGSMAAEGERLERIQKGLNALADLHESGDIPEVLKGIRSRGVFEAVMPRFTEQGKRIEARFPGASLTQSDVREMLEKSKGAKGTAEGRKILERKQYSELPRFSQGEIEDVKAVMDAAVKRGYDDKWARTRLTEPSRLYAAGINEQNFPATQDAIEALGVKKSVPTKEQQIKAAERDLIGTKIEGYFPTPKPLAEQLVEMADIKPGMSVLEPSAGNGAIADELAKKTDQVTAIEPVSKLRDILNLKGHALSEDRDFLSHKGEYDRIVMNPPFERGQDMDHVRHAYDLLKPGGRLVAIMGEGSFFRNDSKATSFRNWLDANGGFSEKLPEGSFTGKDAQRQTGVATRTVVIDKPEARSGGTSPLRTFLSEETGTSTVGKRSREIMARMAKDIPPRHPSAPEVIDWLKKNAAVADDAEALALRLQQRLEADRTKPGDVLRTSHEWIDDTKTRRKLYGTAGFALPRKVVADLKPEDIQPILDAMKRHGYELKAPGERLVLIGGEDSNVSDMPERHATAIKDAKLIDVFVSPEQKTFLERLLSEETGTSNIVPRLKDLKDWAVKTFGPEDAPKLNYSGMGAKETKYVRNLGQTSKAAPGIIPAALRAASPKSQAGVIVATAHPLMRSVLAKSNMNLQDFYTWGVHDRLRGLEQRWRDFASQAQTMSDSDLENALDDGYYLGLLKAIEGKKDMADDVAEVATAISESKDWDVLRTYLDGMFTDAADQVATLMTPEEWKKAAADPNVQEALRIYKTRIEAPMRDDHAINEGVMSSALGQTNTYFPLMPVSADVKGGFGRSFPYRKPKNAFNKFATGLSEEYSTLPGDIRPRLMAGIRTNTKAALVKAAEESGLFKELKPGADRDIVTFEGVDYKASRPFVISDARTIVSNGKVVHVPAKQIVMPAWFEREMAPILEGNKWDLEGVNKVVNLLMKFTLSGPAEAAFHWANITGAIVANTPFLEDSFVGKALSLPLIKRVAAIGYVLSVDPTTDEASKQLVEMAQAGAVPSRFATETYSKRYAEELGAHRRLLTLAPALFGPEGFDIRARLLMWRLGKQINPDATPKEMNLFVNQMGNYVPQLQGELERSLKSTGFSPFYTAGSTMLRNGINAWTAQGPVPGGTTPRILGWKLMTGALGLIGTWIALHKGMTGKYPWEDKRAKFLALPVGGSNGVLNESLRRSALGKAMWGTGPETGYIGVNFFNPLVARGARALGISGAINTSFRGGSGSQQFEAAQRDMFNSLVHPIAGPPLRAAFVLGLGVEPQLSDFRDRRGQISPQFFRAIPQDAKPGLPTLGHKALSLLSLNSFYGNVGEATGLTNNPYRKGDLWLRAITDMSAPGLFGTASNPYKAETALRQQRRAH